MAKKLPPKKVEFYGYVFQNVMASMIRSKTVVVGITLELKKLTEEKMECVANFAGKYYLQHVKKKMSVKDMEELKRESLKYGLISC